MTTITTEELSAALGWPGGVSTPVLDKTELLQMVAQGRTQQEQEPVAWTDRELQLIDGMIEVQLRHAAQCDGIANRPMAERQKGWDMERVALLQKIKSNPPRRETEQEPVAWMVYTQDGKSLCVTDNPADFTDEHRALPLYTHPSRQWRGLSEEEREQATGWSVEHIEAALKEKNQ